MKYSKKLSKYCAALCLCLAGLFCFSLPASASSITALCSQQQTQYIKIQCEQWDSLKRETNLLEAKLQIVSDILATQKGTSMELVQQLAEAKLQLSETQKALNSSKSSLANARKALDDSNKLYETLMDQVEHDRKQMLRIKKQRNVYCVLSICLVSMIATHK